MMYVRARREYKSDPSAGREVDKLGLKLTGVSPPYTGISSTLVSARFFFSSRRRHTRFDCDWSSDVCSSDLANVVGTEATKRFAELLSDIDGATGVTTTGVVGDIACAPPWPPAGGETVMVTQDRKSVV